MQYYGNVQIYSPHISHHYSRQLSLCRTCHKSGKTLILLQFESQANPITWSAKHFVMLASHSALGGLVGQSLLRTLCTKQNFIDCSLPFSLVDEQGIRLQMHYI